MLSHHAYKSGQHILQIVFQLVLILAMLMSPAHPVSAQDEIPPTPSETPGMELTPEPTLEATVTETPLLEPTPTEEPPLEPTPTEETPIPVDETSTPVEETSIPVEVTPTAAEPVIETELPEVVPLEISASGEIIPDQYIVVFKEAVSSPDVVQDAMEKVKNRGGKILHTYGAAFKGFSAKLTPENLKSLRQDPRIAFIEADQVVHVADEGEIGPASVQNPPGNWGQDRIDQVNLPLDNQYYYPTLAGSGVNVYVIDTGIRATHTDFGGRVGLAFDSVGGGPYAVDCDGHGTHVAGIIGGNMYGVANQVALHSVRVLNCNGEGSLSGVILGINWVIANHIHPAVINMSIEGPASSVSDSAVNSAVKHGITFVVAAGNKNKNACNYSPSRVPAAITVASTTITDARSSFSNYGSCVDIFAPGSAILSDFNTSDTATAFMDGTSMASPFVAGAAALYLSANPSANPAAVVTALKAKATKNHVSNPMGSPNNLLFAPNKMTAPVLLTPVNGQFTFVTAPTLVWQHIPDVIAYDLQVDDTPDCSSPLWQYNPNGDIEGDQVNLDLQTLEVGKYYWRVRVHNSSALVGPWSSIFNFTIDWEAPDVPMLSTPLDGATPTGTPTFIWKASPGASRYQFAYGTSLVDPAADPSSVVYQSGVLTTLSHKPPIMMVRTPYYWFVRAGDAADNWSGWSAPFSVESIPPKPAAPALLSPAANLRTNIQTPELTWKGVAFGFTYHLQIDKTYTFAAPLSQEYKDIPELSQVLLEALTPGKYFWRVRASNKDGVNSAWSAYRSFIIDTTPPAVPVLSTPLNGATPTGSPTFIWKASLGAARYQFAYGTSQLDPTADSGSVVYQSGELTTLSHKPPIMEVKTQYYWFVRARDAAGNWSAWSTPFRVESKPSKPAAPALLSPAAGFRTNDDTPELTWKSVAYGFTYELQIDITYTFAAPVQLYENLPGLSQVLEALPEGKYFWRVRASNKNGVNSAWSAYRDFTIDTTPPSVPILNKLADGAETFSFKPSLSVNAVNGAVKYRFQISTENTFISPIRDVTQAATLYTTATPLEYGTYFWRAGSIDAATNSSDWSSVRSFSIVQVIRNGGFEAVNANWTEYSSNEWVLILNEMELGLTPHTGSYAAYLGGDNYETSRLTQTGITLNGVRYLSFWYWIDSVDLCGYDYAKVKVNGTNIKTFNLCANNATQGWRQQILDLQNYAGTTISLVFEVVTDEYAISDFFLDDVSITSSSVVASMNTVQMESSNHLLSKQELLEQTPGE